MAPFRGEVLRASWPIYTVENVTGEPMLHPSLQDTSRHPDALYANRTHGSDTISTLVVQIS